MRPHAVRGVGRRAVAACRVHSRSGRGNHQRPLAAAGGRRRRRGRLLVALGAASSGGASGTEELPDLVLDLLAAEHVDERIEGAAGQRQADGATLQPVGDDEAGGGGGGVVDVSGRGAARCCGDGPAVVLQGRTDDSLHGDEDEEG